MSSFAKTRCPYCGHVMEHHLGGLGFYNKETVTCSYCHRIYKSVENCIEDVPDRDDFEPRDSINTSYVSPSGYWTVWTEGDPDGGSTDRYLGTYEGKIDDIAFALADQAVLTLSFKRANIRLPVPKTVYDTVIVDIKDDYNLKETSENLRIDWYKKFLGANSDTLVESSGYYGCVTFHRKSVDDIKRESALAKLTDEEKALLGLK